MGTASRASCVVSREMGAWDARAFTERITATNDALTTRDARRPTTLWDFDPGLGGDPPAEPPSEPAPEPVPEPTPEPWDPPDAEGGAPGDEDPTPIEHPDEADGPAIEEIPIYEWRTAQDARVCPICGPLDGTRWEGQDGPRPPAHLGCRCARVLVAVETRTIARCAPLGGGGAIRRW